MAHAAVPFRLYLLSQAEGKQNSDNQTQQATPMFCLDIYFGFVCFFSLFLDWSTIPTKKKENSVVVTKM